MSHYRTFTAIEAVEYARQYSALVDAQQWISADEVGDGNLNLVFKIRDAQGRSRVIVKQALPYVRCVGESWPLTLDRARIEAETLQVHGQYCPEHTVKVLYHDAALAVMVQEDLSDHQIWRGELINGVHYPQATRQLGHYLAQTLFHTSDFFQHAQAKKASVIRFTNPELCQITEDLFFTDPYSDHPRNQFDEQLLPQVVALRSDRVLKQQVAALKYRFLSRAEALLHGDIHSGSIFVAPGSLKVIDAEFGFYGPIGFDIGTVLGNLLLNYCGLPGLQGSEQAAAGREQRLQDLCEVWQVFSDTFLALGQQSTQDEMLATEGYIAAFLQQVWTDSLGYCGTELIRRTIGLAHVADLDSISDDAIRLASQRQALSLGRMLICSAAEIKSTEMLISRIRQHDAS